MQVVSLVNNLEFYTPLFTFQFLPVRLKPRYSKLSSDLQVHTANLFQFLPVRLKLQRPRRLAAGRARDAYQNARLVGAEAHGEGEGWEQVKTGGPSGPRRRLQ